MVAKFSDKRGSLSFKKRLLDMHVKKFPSEMSMALKIAEKLVCFFFKRVSLKINKNLGMLEKVHIFGKAVN